MKQRTLFTILATFIRLVFDTFGRMSKIANRFRALPFQIAETRRLIWFNRWTGAFRDCTFESLLSLLCDRGFNER